MKYYEDKIDKTSKISIILLMIVLSGIFGFIYEFIFYYFNSGMKEFCYQGGNFLPWINIYAIGSILIYILCYKYIKSPLKVFLISLISTGVLEYVSGLLIYKLGNGLRFWDYNKEILNFLNIDGFVCLRSVLFFGISGLILMYIMIPILYNLSLKINKKTLLIISIILCSIFLIDEIYNSIISRLFNLPNAINIYKSIGIKYTKL